MRLHILSDLHLEFDDFVLPKVEADVIVFAGDTHTKLNGVKWIKQHVQDKPVLYLMGNHEYYGHKLPALIRKARDEADGTNITILEKDWVEIHGFRFFGATLWTDMNLHGDHMIGSIEAAERMNDYKRIRKSPTYRKLKPLDTRVEHQQTLLFLDKFFQSGEPKKSIVISHHAPSARSLPIGKRTEIISCAYSSHLDSYIEMYQPLIWIHGHIHHSQDYFINHTRILSNPRGYIENPNPNFNPHLIIDLEAELERRK